MRRVLAVFLYRRKNNLFGFKNLSIYVGLLAIGIGAFFFINSLGANLFPNEFFASGKALNLEHENQLFQILLALLLVVLVARLMGVVFKLIRQPPVLGEILGGILLGPSLLGKISPELSSAIFPSDVVPSLGLIAQIGIILYMFLVGLELNLGTLMKSGHRTILISHVSIIFPFLLGSCLALIFFESLAPSGIGFTSFALFLGVSMSVTAFPVLARILTDQGLHKTHLGVLALTCAAIDDVTAWCLLALVVSVAQMTLPSALSTFLLTVVYLAFVFFIVKPIIYRYVSKLEPQKKLAEQEIAVFLILVLLSALITQYIGIHAIFGAFIIGAITPNESMLAKGMSDRLQDLVKILLLPAFFAFTGLRTEISLLNTTEDWLLCGLIIFVAIVGKFGGTLLTARFTGLSWRDSSTLGVLMNTRGLVELIVLNIGLDIGIISSKLFTMLVIMALFTTFMTGPLLQIILGPRALSKS